MTLKESGYLSLEYKVTFKSMTGIALVMTILASLLLYAGIVYHELPLVFVAVAIVSTLIAVRIRYRVYIDSQLIECRNIFGNKVVLLSEITQCCWILLHKGQIDSKNLKNQVDTTGMHSSICQIKVLLQLT